MQMQIRIKTNLPKQSPLNTLTQIYIERVSPYIALFESLRNCKRRNKGSFTLKSYSNKIMLCGGRGQHYLILNKIST